MDRLVRKSILDMDLDEIRRSRASVMPAKAPFTWITGQVFADVAVQDTSFRARDGHERPLRVYRPAKVAGPLPVVVYFHGGGWVLGSTRGYDPLCTFLARAVEAVVVNVDYRMAPEHRAPMAVHDCVDAVRWVGEHADSLGGDASHLAVSGDSAGGNLSAIVCQVVRDEGGPSISHQALLYPATDATKSQPSIREHAAGPVLTLAKIDAFLDTTSVRRGWPQRSSGLAPVGHKPRRPSARADPDR
jgi:acetyl esterase